MIEEPTLTDPSTSSTGPSTPGDERWLQKLDVNYCSRCSRIIELVSGIGWLHVYRPFRRGGPFGSDVGCGVAQPGAPKCSVCCFVGPTDRNGKPKVHANPDTGLPCEGCKHPPVGPIAESQAWTGLNE